MAERGLTVEKIKNIPKPHIFTITDQEETKIENNIQNVNDIEWDLNTCIKAVLDGNHALFTSIHKYKYIYIYI